MIGKIGPFAVLGLPEDADEQSVRARYLALVKKYPPELDPERFQQIQKAYALAKDPVELAAELLTADSEIEDVPTWESVISEFAEKKTQMGLDFLLSLGNRAGDYRAPSVTAQPESSDGAAE